MKSKVILIDSVGNETLVATFRSTVEAFQAAALFQNIIGENTSYSYYVDHLVKGKGMKRTAPDNLRATVSNITNLYNSLKPLYN